MISRALAIDRANSRLNRLLSKGSVYVERIMAELRFANSLSQQNNNAGWAKLVSQAISILTEAITTKDLDSLHDKVEQVEQILAPIGKVAKTYTAHCVGHAHIDMNWMWPWQETVAATIDTFTTVLRLMEEFPDFRFSQSQASVYEIVRKYNPPMFEKIKQLIAQGRWEVSAVHWVEGDKNLASGESLARHLLYTRRFMKEHFGLVPEDVAVDWEPDTFGHAATIPTIVAKGAVRYYYMCRGGAECNPPLFWWQGPDGSRVLVNYEHTWYNDHIGTHNVLGLLSFCKITGLKDWMLVYGVGDHGGGPTRRDLNIIRQMDSWPIYPNFKMSTAGEYFKLLENYGDNLPVIDSELSFAFTGCYTSQADIKKYNRFAESDLERTEAVATLAHRLIGTDYPHEQLREAWIKTLFGHFHDILPGSGVKATREYQSGLFQETMAATGQIKTSCLRALAGQIDTSFAAKDTSDQQANDTSLGAGVGRGSCAGGVSSAGHVDSQIWPFIVFNPNAWICRDTVTVTIWDAESGNVHTKQFVARMADGNSVPAQRLNQGDYWGHRYVDLAVPVEVPPLGYTSFAIEEDNESAIITSHGYTRHDLETPAGTVRSLAARIRSSEPIFLGQMAMENEFLYVEVDRETGAISKLIDKNAGLDLSDPNGLTAALEYVLERPGPMSSWIIHDPRKTICPLEITSVEPAHEGPHLASFVVQAKLGDSSLTVIYSLKSGVPRLDIDIKADWLERGGTDVGIPSLRMRFPFTLDDAKARYEIPYGSIERDLNDGQEVPALRWACVTGKPAGKGKSDMAGCAVLNDSKNGYSLAGSTLSISLIRSSYEPDALPDMGKHQIKLALVPYVGECPVADVVRMATDLNRPLLSVSTDVHQGQLPAETSLVKKLSLDSVIINCVKEAEDEDAVVFRLHETQGKSTTVNVEIDNRLMGQVNKAVQVDLLERAISESASTCTPGSFTAKVPAGNITSIKVTFTGGNSPLLKQSQ